MSLHLKRSIEAVEKLFTDHNLPMREELVAELRLWRGHAEDGVKFVHRCHHFMRTAMQSVRGAEESR